MACGAAPEGLGRPTSAFAAAPAGKNLRSMIDPVAAETRRKLAKAKEGAAHEVVELAKTIVYALLIALVLRVGLFQPFTIPSASMEPTLLVGDYIVVSKFAYGWSKHSFPFSPPLFQGRVFERIPHRGDSAGFKTPRDNSTDFIKRLIGLPGDQIQVKAGALYINGKPVPRERLPRARSDDEPPSSGELNEALACELWKET